MTEFIYHTPINRTVRNYHDGTKSLIENGSIALMCPECFHMTETHISSYKVVIGILNKVNDFYITNDYYGVCPNCNEDVKFEQIDINIAQTINILNNKGYYTAFCCEGHVEPNIYDGNEEFSSPYIYFYIWRDSEVLETNPLPDTWYIEEDDKHCEVFTIRSAKSKTYFEDESEYEKYLKWAKNEWDKKKALEDIYNWAVSLPEKSVNKKIANEILLLNMVMILFTKTQKRL